MFWINWSNTVKGGESRLQRFVSEAGDEDARSRYREEEADNNVNQRNHGSISSGNEDRTMIAFEPNDPENPYNWSKASHPSPSFVATHGLIDCTGKESFHCFHEHGDCSELNYGQRAS